MTDTPKRFAEWEKVECNDCTRYWLDQCDGVSKASTKPCNSFLATRSVVIPEKLNRLESELKVIKVVYGLSIIALVIMIWLVVFNG